MALLPANLRWYSARLSCGPNARAPQGRRMLDSVLRSLKRKCPDLRYVRVWHRSKTGYHVHLLIGTASKLDESWVRGRWARILDKPGNPGYSPARGACKASRSPCSWLAYALGIRVKRDRDGKNRRRKGRPWGGMRGKVQADTFRRP